MPPITGCGDNFCFFIDVENTVRHSRFITVVSNDYSIPGFFDDRRLNQQTGRRLEQERTEIKHPVKHRFKTFHALHDLEVAFGEATARAVREGGFFLGIPAHVKTEPFTDRLIDEAVPCGSLIRIHLLQSRHIRRWAKLICVRLISDVLLVKGGRLCTLLLRLGRQAVHLRGLRAVQGRGRLGVA